MYYKPQVVQRREKTKYNSVSYARHWQMLIYKQLPKKQWQISTSQKQKGIKTQNLPAHFQLFLSLLHLLHYRHIPRVQTLPYEDSSQS